MNKNPSDYRPYLRLLAMAVLSFVAMYILMYAMVDTYDNVYRNLNQFYMAGLMAAPMAMIELALMRAMYPDRRFNIAIAALSTLALILFWTGIRQQTAITDREFLRSMIPHHAGAILMCKEAPLSDPAIKQLCQTISAGQADEIRQMKTLLNGLEN